MKDPFYSDNISNHHEDLGEWAMSVASLPPGNTFEDIVQASPQIAQRVARVITAGELQDAGFLVVEDDPPHALVLLPDGEEATRNRLRDMFAADERANELHDERKRRRGNR